MAAWYRRKVKKIALAKEDGWIDILLDCGHTLKAQHGPHTMRYTRSHLKFAQCYTCKTAGKASERTSE